MSAPTIDDLRTMLDDRADGVEPPMALAHQVRARASERRRRRAIGVTAGAVLVAAAAVAPLVVHELGDRAPGTVAPDVATPSGPDASSSDDDLFGADDLLQTPVWVDELPGLDLPRSGGPWVGLHADDAWVVDGARSVELAAYPSSPVRVGDDHVLVAVSFVAGGVDHRVVAWDDGELQRIDDGEVLGAAVIDRGSRPEIVYGWRASPGASAGEVRALDPVSGERRTIASGVALRVATVDGAVVLASADDRYDRPTLVLDPETDAISDWSEADVRFRYEGLTPGGLRVAYDEVTRCFVARTAADVEVWEVCDEWLELAPGNQYLFGLDQVVDAETGAAVAALPLTGDDDQLHFPNQPTLVGFEGPTHAIYDIGRISAADGTVLPDDEVHLVRARCDVSGACALIPGPA